MSVSELGSSFLYRHRWLLAVLLLGLVVRCGWALRQPTDREALRALPDQVEYVALADRLLADGELWFVDPAV